MPQAIVAAASAVTTWLNVTVGLSLAASQAIVMGLAYATDAVLLSAANKLLLKKTGETRGMEVSLVDSTADSRVIYGEVRTGGVNMIPPYTSNTDGRYLHQVLALCMHEIDSYQAYYLDQEQLATPAAITGTDGDGLVTGSGTYKDAVWVRGYTGTMTQNVDYILNTAFPTQWPTTSRGRGCAYVALRYDYGKGKVYRGVPPATFKVRGAKVYDPRLDSTNGGSGSQRYTDPTTWTYSNNPALCWAHYHIIDAGFGVDPATEIDWTSVITAADVCDVLVANKDGGTRKRYTCNGVLVNTPESLADNSRRLIDAMYGRETFINGKHYCYAGAWTAPSWTIEKTDWTSINHIQAVGGRDSGRCNITHCFYVDPNRNWQRVECSPRVNTTYKSDDMGEPIDYEMEQPMCTDESEAQMKAEFLLRGSRNGVKLIGVLPPRFHKIRTFDTVAVNFSELGWVSKTFRVSAMKLFMNGSVLVALSEEQEADWGDLASGDYNTVSTASIPATNPTVPTALASFSITPLLGNLQFDFEEPVVRPLGTRYQVIRSPGSLAVAGSYSVVWEGDATRVLYGADPRSFWWYHARAVTGSYVSPLSPSTYGIGVIPWITPETVPGNRSYPDGELMYASTSYWAGVNLRSTQSYWLEPTGGVMPNLGVLKISCTSDSWSDGGFYSRINPLRFDVNSRGSTIGAPMFPGQSGMVMATYRRVAAGPSITLRVSALSVSSPKGNSFGDVLVSIGINTVSPTSGQWMTAIGSFTMPASTVYNAACAYLRFFDSAQVPGDVEIGGIQMTTL